MMTKTPLYLIVMIGFLGEFSLFAIPRTDMLAPISSAANVSILAENLTQIFQNSNITNKKQTCLKYLSSLDYFNDSNISRHFYFRKSLIWFIDQKRNYVWSFHWRAGSFEGFQKPLKPVQDIALEFANVNWSAFDNENDEIRYHLREKVQEINQRNTHKLIVFVGRISRQICKAGRFIYIPLALDDELFGLVIHPEKKTVEIMPLRQQREQEIKARIQLLKLKYYDLIPKGTRIWRLMVKVAGIVDQEQGKIKQVFEKSEPLVEEEIAIIENWFDHFVMSRDHGFLHALKDLEFVLEQLKQAIKNEAVFNGKVIILEDVRIKELIYGTILHDIAAIIRRNNHHRTGANIAGIVLRRLHFPKRDIAKIAGIIKRHRGNDYLPPRTLEEHLLAYADELTATEVGTRLYYLPGDLNRPWLNEKITFAYRMLAQMGIFQHENRSKDAKPDPALFHLYSLIMRSMEMTSNVTYGDFEPIKLLLPNRLKNEVSSLKRQIRFDERYTDETAAIYYLLIDAFVECAEMFFKIRYVRNLFETYQYLMPLFSAPPLTHFSEQEDWSKYIRPELKNTFQMTPKETQKEILQTVTEIFKMLNIMEPQFKRSLQQRFAASKLPSKAA